MWVLGIKLESSRLQAKTLLSDPSLQETGSVLNAFKFSVMHNLNDGDSDPFCGVTGSCVLSASLALVKC